MIGYGEVVDLLRLEGDGAPVVSLYLAAGGGDPEAARSFSSRFHAALKPLAELAEQRKDGDREWGMALRDTLERLRAMEPDLARIPARGIAVFVCLPKDCVRMFELPRRVRDRAYAGERPYVRPLLAILDEYRRYCAVVIDRARAWMFESYMGELRDVAEIQDEAPRKKNFAGWYGLEEHRVRNHARESAHRHYRAVAQQIFDLFRAKGFDLLFVGGHQETVAEFLPFLHSYLRDRLAGTFVIDPATMTAGTVKQECATLEQVYERREEERLVEEVVEAASARRGMGVLGLDDTLAAANLAAIATLVVDDDRAAPGVYCGACGLLATSGNRCPICGAQLETCTDVVEALVEGVIDEGGRIEHIYGDTALREHLVGALTRFPVEPAVASGESVE